MILTIAANCFLPTVQAQSSASIVERVKRSLSENEPDWKIVIVEVSPARRSADGTIDAILRFSSAGEEASASLTIYGLVRAAKNQFKTTGEGASTNDFRVAGIGDEAFLFPPKVREDGAYNLRFRRARVEVWVSAASEATVRRFAKHIAAAIPAPGKQQRRTTTGKKVLRPRRLSVRFPIRTTSNGWKTSLPSG